MTPPFRHRATERNTVTGEPDLIGRERELALLVDRCVELPLTGRRVVLIDGEQGVGKSALLQRAAAQLTRRGLTPALVRCWPYAGAPPLWPWQRLVDQMTDGVAPVDTPSAGRPDLPFDRFQLLADRIAGLSRRHGPLVLGIDDLHLASNQSLLFALFLVRALADEPVAVLATCRSGIGPDPTRRELLADLEAEADVVDLKPLDSGQIHQLAVRWGATDADPAAAAVLTRLTGGRPLDLWRCRSAGPAVAAWLERAGTRFVASLDATARQELALALAVGSEPAHPGRESRPPKPDIQQVLWAALAPGERHRAHHRLAVSLGAGAGPRAALMSACHAVAAAEIDPDHCATAAVEACRAATGRAPGPDGPRALALLERAAQLVPGSAPSSATLLAELGELALANGRVGSARTWFGRGVEASDQLGDPVSLARCALGVGRPLLLDPAPADDDPAAADLLHRAEQGLPADEAVLRARLALRRAGAGGPPGPGPAAGSQGEPLASCRTLGDQLALMEALATAHATCHDRCLPTDRLGLADELLAVATAAGHRVGILAGLLARAVSLCELGRPESARAQAELGQAGRDDDSGLVAYHLAGLEVLQLLRAGRLDDAASAARTGLDLGRSVCPRRAETRYVEQMAVVRRLQGGEGDLLAELDSRCTPAGADARHGLLVAWLAGRSGARARAETALRRLWPAALDGGPGCELSLAEAALLAEVALDLDAPRLAATVYRRLSASSSLVVAGNGSSWCLGSIEWSLGAAAAAAGEQRRASGHLERAVEANEALGNRPMATAARGALGLLLLDDSSADRRSMGVRHLTRAAAEAPDAGMAANGRSWAARADAARPTVCAPMTLAAVPDGWRLRSGDREVEVPAMVGFSYIGALLAQPGVDIAAVDLCHGGDIAASPQELVDRTGLARYRQRLQELDGEIDDAEDRADLGRAERLRLEREALLDEVGRAVGLAGRQRRFAGTSERARVAVTKAIKRAIDVLEGLDPELGADLRASIRTGTRCRYLAAEGRGSGR